MNTDLKISLPKEERKWMMDIRKNRAIKAAHNDYVSWAREQEEKEKKLMIEIEHIGDV